MVGDTSCLSGTWKVTRSRMVCRTDGVGGKTPPYCANRCPNRAPPPPLAGAAALLPGVRPSCAAIAGVSGGRPLTGVRASFGPPAVQIMLVVDRNRCLTRSVPQVLHHRAILHVPASTPLLCCSTPVIPKSSWLARQTLRNAMR